MFLMNPKCRKDKKPVGSRKLREQDVLRRKNWSTLAQEVTKKSLFVKTTAFLLRRDEKQIVAVKRMMWQESNYTMFVASYCTSNKNLKDQVLSGHTSHPMTPAMPTEGLGSCQNRITEAGRKGKKIISGPSSPSFSALPSQHWQSPTRSQKLEKVGDGVQRGRLGGTGQGRAGWRVHWAGK